MANDEHVAILQKGVDAWNAWRGKNDVRPDLSGANLHRASLVEAKLSDANLRGANLSEANLYGADPSGAHLFEADLSKAHLSPAKLRRASLSGAHLGEADLSKADLRWADLSEAKLHRADLREADLEGANLRESDLCDADLWGAVQPLLLEGSSLYSMFKDFNPQDFHWVLPVCRYKEPEQLLATLAENVIAPAEGKGESPGRGTAHVRGGTQASIEKRRVRASRRKFPVGFAVPRARLFVLVLRVLGGIR
jgi:hypothetical protein